MNDIKDQYAKKLNDEADRWVEEELAKRMSYAREAIEEQARAAMPEVGPGKAENHRKKALVYAEEEIRMELEFEAQNWIDEQLKNRESGQED